MSTCDQNIIIPFIIHTYNKLKMIHVMIVTPEYPKLSSSCVLQHDDHHPLTLSSDPLMSSSLAIVIWLLDVMILI